MNHERHLAVINSKYWLQDWKSWAICSKDSADHWSVTWLQVAFGVMQDHTFPDVKRNWSVKNIIGLNFELLGMNSITFSHFPIARQSIRCDITREYLLRFESKN